MTPDDAREWFMGNEGRRAMAFAEAEQEVRGMHVSEGHVNQVIVDALRRHDAFAGPIEIALLARKIARPWEPLLRPIKHKRWIDQLFSTPDSAGEAFERESDELDNAFDDFPNRFPEYRSRTSRRTVDGGVHTVWVEPCTPEVAERFQQHVAPIPIIVVPA